MQSNLRLVPHSKSVERSEKKNKENSNSVDFRKPSYIREKNENVCSLSITVMLFEV